jgi:integrase
MSSRRHTHARRQGSAREVAPGKWHVRLTLSPTIRFNKTVLGTRADALAVLNQQIALRDAGSCARPNRKYLGEWIEEWLAHHCASQSVRTRYDSRAILYRYLPKTMLARRLPELTRADVQAWLNGLTTEKHLSPRTVQLARATLRNCLARAMKLELLTKNVACLVDIPTLRRQERVVLSPDGAQRFFQAAKGHPFEMLFTFLLHTGLRPGEALALRWRDVQNGTLRVQHALVRVKGHAPHLSSTKTGVIRSIPLGPALLAALQRHRKAQVARRLLLGDVYEDLDLIFPNELGGFANAGNILTRHFKPLLKAAGMPTMRLYDLRHSNATILLAAGEQVKVVQERLEHSNSSLTLDTYAHVLPNAQASTSLRLEALLA